MKTGDKARQAKNRSDWLHAIHMSDPDYVMACREVDHITKKGNTIMKVNDRVESFAGMFGTVIKVEHNRRINDGNAMAKVRWDNGYEGWTAQSHLEVMYSQRLMRDLRNAIRRKA